MKLAFPSRACVIAYLDGQEVDSVSGGAAHTYISVAKGSNHITVQSTNTDGLSCGWNGVCRNSIRAAVGVTGGLVPKLSAHRRASVPLEILINLSGTPPFRVQPDQNSQATNLHGTGWKNLHLPQTGIIYRRYVGRPYRPPGGEQASEALFCRNAERISLAIGLAS